MSMSSECTFDVKYITLIRLKFILMILILTQMTWMRGYETTTKLGCNDIGHHNYLCRSIDRFF